MPQSTHLSVMSRFICLFLLCLSTVTYAQQYEEDETGFYLVFTDSENEQVNQVLGLIADDQELLFDIVDELNDYLVLPVAIPIVFADCGVVNAFYDPQNMQVTICHEMILNSYFIFYNLGFRDEDLSIAIANQVFGILYHEVGHALVDVLELPITGREEDAVDQFSVVSLLVFDELGQEALIHNAMNWAAIAQESETDLENMPFWDEHSLSSQRYYDILCLTYGSDSENLYFLVEDGFLPESRAVRCESEFERVANAWEALLEPYVRE